MYAANGDGHTGNAVTFISINNRRGDGGGGGGGGGGVYR